MKGPVTMGKFFLLILSLIIAFFLTVVPAVVAAANGLNQAAAGLQ